VTSFSVVTPNYNMATYLEKTIQSVLCNLRPGDEYFIIDGGSDDGSIEIIHKYEEYLSGWLSERDNGYSDALYKGFAISSNECQCWINSGDVLLDGALNAARREFNSSDADFIYGNDFYISDSGEVISFASGYISNLQNAMLFGGWTPLQDACFWRQELYTRVGGINKDLQYAADYDLFLRFALSGRARYVDRTFSAFRKHEGQKSIAGLNHYKMERESIRLRTRKKIRVSVVRDVMLSLYYWFFLRLRARAHPWRSRTKRLEGAPIKSLPCGSYNVRGG